MTVTDTDNFTMPTDIEILRTLQDGLPVEPRPYRHAAGLLGMTEEELLSRLRKLIKQGVVKRVAASLNHRKIGLQANAMVAWIVPEEKTDEAGRIAAGLKEVSHCYERETAPGWPYNFYTMIHGRTKADCEDIIEHIAEKTGLSDRAVLYSTREFKKTAPRI